MQAVLLIDDDEIVRFALSAALRKAGFLVIEAASGNDKVINDTLAAVDAVVTDVIMPDKEGIAVLLDIRRDYPEMPVFVISGGGRIPADHYLTSAEGLGATGIFQKPFDERQLVSALQQSLA